MSVYELTKPYNQYADDIVTGRIKASRNIILACRRYQEWFKRDDIYMDYEEVDRRIRVVGRLKHWKGVYNKKPFILLPYQQWIFANIFGWKWKDTNLRVTKNVLLFMARKSGKTALASALCISQLLLDNNNGQEIDCLANSGAQAKILFEMNRNFTKSIDPNGIIFKRYRDTIKMPHTDSEIAVRNADSMTLDGLNSSTFILDEYHAAKTTELYDVMKTSQGAQQQPLAIVITTAGFLLATYPLYEMRKMCIDILEGKKKDDTQFTALYEQDEDDDWMNDESCWIKSNPSLGYTVMPQYLRDQVQSVKNQPSNTFGVLTKNFNMFCQSSDTWIQEFYLNKVVQHVDLEDFKDEEAYIGVDLAAVSDLTCTTIMFPPNPNRAKYPDKFVFKTICYVPSSTLDGVNGQKYSQFSNVDKYTFRVIDGNVTDYNEILKDQMSMVNSHNVQYVAYDSWNSTQWAIEATNQGLPLVPFSQSLGNFNKPTKDLERMVLSGKCIIDDAPFIKWCFNNVVLKRDYNENIKPSKETKENKIDPVISMCEALGAYLSSGGGDVEVV
ncbi:MAG: terminase large subunit [Methanobrevibacter sp.]|nr:terminase large subunit [Methanobrevibacter sp.]